MIKLDGKFTFHCYAADCLHMQKFIFSSQLKLSKLNEMKLMKKLFLSFFFFAPLLVASSCLPFTYSLTPALLNMNEWISKEIAAPTTIVTTELTFLNKSKNRKTFSSSRNFKVYLNYWFQSFFLRWNEFQFFNLVLISLQSRIASWKSPTNKLWITLRSGEMAEMMQVIYN